ncbi:MAG: nucleotidyltransferase domain-containing protein [Deltaproteobacteria bacterium]|nr:nucleotidyltransferase domain-containing protein [Deltaproteobacteria bacterium]MDH4122012.1 nucleotidyltransferase domain-containing protein [Deltaproteobacteria bacterium]
MEPITQDTMTRMVSAIVRAADPEKILLFGSRAKGNFRVDSDVDFLVIEREPFGGERRREGELSHIRKALWDFQVPIDLLVFSMAEVERWKNSINHVIGRSLREGVVLYERPV